MPKELQDQITDRFSAIPLFSNRLSLHPAEDSNPAPLPRQTEVEREYLATCQKLEQLVERKRGFEDATVDIASLHQELRLIGTRIQRQPDDRSHEEDYLAVLQQLKENLWRKLEAEDLKAVFQKHHVELLNLGHKLGFESPAADPPTLADDLNLGDVERQIDELQAQIRGLHDHG